MDLLSRLIFEGSSIRIGEWRCYPGCRLWNEENVSSDWPTVVFPRSAVHIHQSGRELFVTTPNQVVFYNRQQTYRRAMAGRQGDFCEYVYLQPELVAEIHSALGIRVDDDPWRPFKESHGPCHTKAFLVLRSICKLVACDQFDPLWIEESFLSILPRIFLDSVRQNPNPNRPSKPSTVGKHRLLVERIKEYLYVHYSEEISLAGIAQVCESSPFHICRVFRKQAGSTILQYLISLRLRKAFELVIDSQIPLAGIALQCGFSSQSHLSNLFAREFGISPGFLRRNKPLKIVRQVLQPKT